MRKNIKPLLVLLAFSLILSSIPGANASAAKKVSITKTAKVAAGKATKIKLKNNKKKVTWKVIKGQNIIKIKKKTKTYATIQAIKEGSAKVQAKIGKKKYTCNVTVKAKTTTRPTGTSAVTEEPTGIPAATTKPTGTPMTTATPIEISTTTAKPIKLRDGALEKDLYEITVKDNATERSLLIKGMSDDEIWIPSLLAVDGSHFCFTSEKGHGTLLSSDKIMGTVNGSGMEVLFKYENQGGAGSDGGLRFSGQAAYCDLYAKAKDGKPISGLSLDYNNEDGELNMGIVSMICYDSEGKITQRTHRDGFYEISGFRGINGYSMLTHWGTSWNGLKGQIFPDLKLGRKAYAILDDDGDIYTENYGEGNRYTWAYKTDESNDEFTVLAPDGSKIADVLVSCHATDYFSTSASDFDYDYEVKNLAEGWNISLNMSETSTVPSMKTGESIPCDPALLMSVKAERSSDDGLIPISYEIDGSQDLTFRFKGIDGIKEIKKIYFNCSENVQDGEGDWLSWVYWDKEDFDFDIEKGEVTIPKDDIYELFYERYPSAGNSYQGSMTYITEDGTEKTAYGDWYIKVLEEKNKQSKIVCNN